MANGKNANPEGAGLLNRMLFKKLGRGVPSGLLRAIGRSKYRPNNRSPKLARKRG